MTGSDLGGDPPCWAHLTSDADHRDPLPASTAARLLADLADGVVIADTAGVITYWNGSAERIFGWTADEAIGQTLDLLVPERQRGAHWSGYQRVMRTGQTKYGHDLLRVPSCHRDGQRRSITFTVTLVRNTDNKIQGIAAVIRDETQRWADEQALRRQVTQTETT